MLSAEKAYERRWYTLAVLCMSLVIITIDNSILNVALPTIVRDLGASGSDLQWIIDAYVIVFACLLLTAGALGDKFGRKKALTFGLLLFGGFSGLASLATTPEMLIVARGLMGIGAAFIFPTTLSILTNTFTGRERAKAIGVWAGVSGIGVALGPMLGGILVEHFYWGSVFFVNVPICALALVLGRFYIPDSRDPDNRPLDPVGALLSIVTLVALLYSIIQAPEKGWTSPEVVGAFFVGLALLGVFAWWEIRAQEPMIDVRVFKNPRFSAASSVLTLTSFALYGSVFLLIQYFQFVLGYSPLEAGLLAMPVAIAMMVVSPNAPRLVRRWGTKRVVVLGLLVAAVAMLCYGSDAIMSSFVGGCAVRLLFGIGLGLTSAPATESIMGSLPPSRAGVGSAINDTTRQTGGALGVAIIGSVFLAAYHHYADKAVHLSAASSAAVHDSVGRALELANKLPAKQGEALVQLSRDAFVDAMRITYPIAAAFIILAAVIAWLFLPAHGHDEFATDDDAEEAREISEYEILGAERLRVTIGHRAWMVAAIAVGGALGTVARYELALAEPVTSGAFPWATFTANLAGSLVLGAAVVLLAETRPATRVARAFLAVGFCGGLTTFSTWMVESVLLTREREGGTAVVYLVVSLVAGLVAVAAGIAAARLVVHRPAPVFDPELDD